MSKHTTLVYSFNRFRFENSRIKHGCNMDILHFINLRSNDVCSYTNIVFDKINKPSFERLDTSLGYIPGNIIRITTNANSNRQDYSSSDLEVACIKLSERIKRIKKCLRNYKSSKVSEADLKRGLNIAIHKLKLLESLKSAVKVYENLNMLQRFKIYNGLNINTPIKKVIGVAYHDFCLRAFCKGQRWLLTTLSK